MIRTLEMMFRITNKYLLPLVIDFPVTDYLLA